MKKRNSLSHCVSTSSRGGTRTPDPVINSHLLYHLSYSGSTQQAKNDTRESQLARG